MSLRCKKCGRFIPADAEFRIIDGENYCETCTPSEPTQTALIETDTLRVREVNTRRNERRFVTDSPAEMRRWDNDSAYNETFVLLAKDVDSAVVTIHDWIVCETRNNPHLDEKEKAAAADFDMTILSGVTIPCYRVIEKEFSEAYMQPVP